MQMIVSELLLSALSKAKVLLRSSLFSYVLPNCVLSTIKRNLYNTDTIDCEEAESVRGGDKCTVEAGGVSAAGARADVAHTTVFVAAPAVPERGFGVGAVYPYVASNSMVFCDSRCF